MIKMTEGKVDLRNWNLEFENKAAALVREGVEEAITYAIRDTDNYLVFSAFSENKLGLTFSLALGDEYTSPFFEVTPFSDNNSFSVVGWSSFRRWLCCDGTTDPSG